MRTGVLAVDRQLDRWYDLIPHPVQLELVQAVPDGVRFPLVPAGRRSGKTERFKRFIVKQAIKEVGQYFAAAPTYAQAKKIFWQDLKAFSLSATHPRRPSESDLIIFLPNGSEIHVIGLDRPERIEGIPWTGGGIDEFADVKASAWESNIFPALNTVDPRRPDFRAWCWLLGVPDGLNHYYDLCEYAKTDPDGEFLYRAHGGYRGLQASSSTWRSRNLLEAADLRRQTVSEPQPVPATATTSSPSGTSPASQASITISQQTLTPWEKRRSVWAMI